MIESARTALRLADEHPRTLDEVGRTFNVTRERIRQIENQSLKKLQQLGKAQKCAKLPSRINHRRTFRARRLGRPG